MKHAAVELNGILRDQVNGQPSEDGRALYFALAEGYRITILADADQVSTERWLRIEGFDRHTQVLFTTAHVTRSVQIKILRSTGPLDLVVTADPSLAQPLLDAGQPSLVYINPRQYTTLPPREEWDQIVVRIDENRARAASVLADEEDEE